MVKQAPNRGGFEVKKKLKQKLAGIIFVSCWFGIYLLAGSLEQHMISSIEYIVYSLVTFVAIGVSGILSGMFTEPDERRTK